MKKIKHHLLAIMLITSSYSAWADRPHFHHRAVGVGVGVGIYVNPFPIYGGRYYYGAPYYPYTYPYSYAPEIISVPVITNISPVITPPTTIIYEQASDVPAYDSSNGMPNNNNNNNDWLYCHQPDGFYPAIKNCPGGWQRVPK